MRPATTLRGIGGSGYRQIETMKIMEIERTAFFKALVHHLGIYKGDPTSQELENLAENRGHMLLIVRMRWIFILMLCAYWLYAGSLLISPHPSPSYGIELLIMPICTLFAASCCNLFYQLFYRELSHFSRANHLQILLDVIAATAMIHFGGGIVSPFWAIYPVITLEASVLLERKRDTWLICLSIISAVGILLFFKDRPHLNPTTSALIAQGLYPETLYALLLWVWTALITAAMTIIGARTVGASRRKALTLKQLVVQDQTTKLYNRSYFFKELNSEIQRSIRYDHTFSIIFLDIDHFKEFNDMFGHLEGDRVLKELAEILRKNVRRSETNPPYDIDVPCRYGGEEFGIILPETPISTTSKKACPGKKMNAGAFAERIRQEIESLRVQGNKITVSIGIASFPEHGNTPDELVKAVDDALYQAKRAGKNRIVIAGT